jgi:hypothetical protein
MLTAVPRRTGERGVALLELDAATAHSFEGSAHVGHLDDGLPRRPGLGGI